MGNSKNVSRGKKRRNMFYKKKENNSLSEKDNTSKFNSLRGAKIKSRLHSCCYDNENYNIIMNLKLLKLFLKDCFCCPECSSSDISLVDKLSSRMGYAHKLSLTCNACKFNKETYTSTECVNINKVQGRIKFEINIRAVASFREIGRGHESLVNFSRCMNMFSIQRKTYNSISESLHGAYENAAEQSMQKATHQIKENLFELTNPYPLCCVSVDGTWQKRGFNSMNGIVTALNAGKCIDIHVLSKHCKKCATYDALKKNNINFDYDKKSRDHVKINIRPICPTNGTYRPNINFAIWTHLILRPVFLELSSDELLKKCLHGQTQNSNEALNHIVWKKCPKNIYVSRTILELGVYSAILEFNEGSFGVDLVFKQYGILCSQPFLKLSYRRDSSRVKTLDKKSTDVAKQRRKTIRTIKKGLIDIEDSN